MDERSYEVHTLHRITLNAACGKMFSMRRTMRRRMFMPFPKEMLRSVPEDLSTAIPFGCHRGLLGNFSNRSRNLNWYAGRNAGLILNESVLDPVDFLTFHNFMPSEFELSSLWKSEWIRVDPSNPERLAYLQIDSNNLHKSCAGTIRMWNVPHP